MSSPGASTRLAVGALWLLLLAVVAYNIGGASGAFWWFAPAALVWVISVKRTPSGAQRRHHHLHAHLARSTSRRSSAQGRWPGQAVS